MLALILVAVVATNIAVAVMFIMMRRNMAAAPIAIDEGAASEVEALVADLRRDVERADVELGRQKLQLRRMLAEVERRQTAVPHGMAPALTPVFTRKDVVSMAAEGLSFRAIAARTGMSVEEARLMLAMEDAA